MLGDRRGSAWAKLISNKGKFFVAWQACWKGIREAPRKDRDRMRGWLCMQIQGSNPIIEGKTNAYGDHYIGLGAFMPGAADTAVRFLQHRPLPPEAQINELKVTRQRGVWYVVITVKNEVAKDYPATGLSCGIDPGVTTPCTLAGDQMGFGEGAVEYGPGRPLTKALKKLRRLQRKLDRQRRANNPECFREDGTWIKGKRMTSESKGMRETEDRIARVHARCGDIRKDAWNKAADEILSKYDTVYLGSWKDGTPQQKGKRRDERKQKFAESGEKRAKGEAARQTTRERNNRDNALGIFRQTLEEKARRSQTPKTVVIVNERNTTRGCARCGALAGPTGVKGLSRRKWTCPECGFKQKRDCSAAWNILQAGKRQQAGGQPVTGGRNPSVAGSSQGLRGSVPGIKQTTASGQVVSSSRGAPARSQPTVSQGDGNIRKRGPSKRKRAGPPPLAKGTASSRKDSS